MVGRFAGAASYFSSADLRTVSAASLPDSTVESEAQSLFMRWLNKESTPTGGATVTQPIDDTGPVGVDSFFGNVIKTAACKDAITNTGPLADHLRDGVLSPFVEVITIARVN